MRQATEGESTTGGMKGGGEGSASDAPGTTKPVVWAVISSTTSIFSVDLTAATMIEERGEEGRDGRVRGTWVGDKVEGRKALG
jgi:hypothetical protein